MKEIILILISYLYGSIPFALVIGKLFFNTDIRLSGSGNLGGTNAGRVLGKPVGLAVIILDASKAMIVVLLTSYLCSVLHINQDLKYICALACVIGHCWPIFAGFKGGKAVSNAIGYFFAVYPLWALAVLPVFLIILKIFKSAFTGTICIISSRFSSFFP